LIRQDIESYFPTSLRHVVMSHGWVNLAPWHWDEFNNELSRTERLETGRSVLVKLCQSGPRFFRIQVDAEALGEFERKDIESRVNRWLSLDWDPQPSIDKAMVLNRHIALYLKQGGGRFLRSSTFYEDFVKTICTINANWAYTVQMVSSLVKNLGDGTFPTPASVVESGEKFLRETVRLGFRARVVVESSQKLLARGVINNWGNLTNRSPSYGDLMSLRGVGEYSANHVRMLSHDFSRVPIDSEVTRYCKERYNVEPGGIESFFDLWGDHRYLGYKISRMLDDVKRFR